MWVVAYHEAGHLNVLQAYGGFGTSAIWRNDRCAVGEKAWLGQTRILVPTGRVERPHETVAWRGPLLPVPERWRVIFGMAGFVAERIYAGDTTTDEIYCSLADALCFDDDLSATDQEFTGDEWTSDDVSMTLELLRCRWVAVQSDASTLVEFGKI